MESTNHIELFRRKMKNAGINPLVIRVFEKYYRQLLSGKNEFIRESEILPLKENRLKRLEDLSAYTDYGNDVLAQTAVFKLNGGLGTSMGLDGPKCLIPVDKKLTFLDIAIRQIKLINKKYHQHIPLYLMNSFNTENETKKYLKKHYPEFLPFTFMQHKYPKILRDKDKKPEDFNKPARYNKNRKLEWNPPGHGDIYLALITSDIMNTLLKRNIKYLFISNIDNLGATLDPRLLGYFAQNDFPFMMEIIKRTEMDKKGGHLACRKNGQILLRERAQVHKDDIPAFENITLHRYFNSNTIWVNLVHLNQLLRKNKNIINLPLIANEKTLDPNDETTPKVVQLETAMGALIEHFKNSEAVIIPKERFIPVKNTNDLLALWSDCYILDRKTFCIFPNPERKLPPITINLDPRFYKTYRQLKKNFYPQPPSLIECSSLRVEGNVQFGKRVVIKGNVCITNEIPARIPDKKIITHSLTVHKN